MQTPLPLTSLATASSRQGDCESAQGRRSLEVFFRESRTVENMMARTEPGTHRQQLGFEDAVIANFDFLRSYGLTPVEKSSTFLRFESKKVFVDIYHGRASFEIGVHVGLKARSEKYGLDYIVSWAGQSAWEAEGFGRCTIFQVSSREGVQRLVPRVAELLKKYGKPFLRGDPAFYERLDEANRRASAEYTRRQLLEGVRKQANAAWAQKSFSRVTELYRSMPDQLTDIEAKRLAYAEKQIRRAGG